MSGLEIASPSFIPDRPLLKAHKALPRRRENIHSLEHDLIPIGIQTSEHDFNRDSNGSSLAASAPTLPLTPPSQPKEAVSEQEDLTPRKSSVQQRDEVLPVSTPTHQLSPPTPDTTPPREMSKTPRAGEGYYSLQPPSMSSRTQSFTTAREAISDEEKEAMSAKNTPTIYPSRKKPSKLRHSLPTTNSSSSELGAPSNSASTSDRTRNRELLDPHVFGSFDGQWTHRREGEPATSSVGLKQNRSETRRKNKGRKPRGSTPSTNPSSNADVSERTDSRERSLRERVQDSQNVDITASVEKFGQDIGWVSGVDDPFNLSDRVNSWRYSGLSTTSTVEAMVIDSQPQVKRTLRHTEKNPSLRSASSPVPNSNRNSMTSDGSQRRLVHKSGRISNQNRWSVTSDMSVPVSTNSSPRRRKGQEHEIIPVVVIPERRSSLKSSAPSSRNHSMTRSQNSSRRPTTAPDNGSGSFDIPRRRKRTMSESLPSAGSSRDMDNRRGREFTPTIPARRSSLSAPTSRNNSRTTSLTSEALQHHRRATATEPSQKSESEKASQPQIPPQKPSEKSPVLSSSPNEATLEPVRSNPEPSFRDSGTNTDDILALRRRSFLATPFTQPSIQSSSPGPIEINEAKAVSLFSHNNKSLFLVDQYMQPESRAVQRLRTSPGGLGVSAKPQTPPPTSHPVAPNFDSPLRNPRSAPQPPVFKIIPPTPAQEIERRFGNASPVALGNTSPLARRIGSVRRALSGRRRRLSSEPFPSPFSRSLWSRTNASARNRKAGEDIDSRLHPLWRPRGFWDDVSESESDDEEYFGDQGYGGDAGVGRAGDRDSDYIVSNSLGIPQKRVIFDGPLSLVRRIQGSRPSHGNLAARHGSRDRIQRPISPRHRRGRRVHSVPALGLQFRFMSFRDVQERIELSRQRRDEARREARREKLRKSIGEKVLVDSSATATAPRGSGGEAFQGRRAGEGRNGNAHANANMM
ncbi:hypothetical protein FQN54_004956 [Arachnomyces sp. PD_36]|nr:hypothetical protein FQN54_004956 [Arachnomyces sp. PD_36]